MYSIELHTHKYSQL